MPAATTRVAVAGAAVSNGSVAGTTELQVFPPSADRRIWSPRAVVITHVGSTQRIDVRSAITGTARAVQVRPPSVVRSSVDRAPTAYPFAASAKNSAVSPAPAAAAGSHVPPPSRVRKIVPALVAAKPRSPPTNAMSRGVTFDAAAVT